MNAKRSLELFFEEKDLEQRIFVVEHNELIHMVESDYLQDIIINHTPAAVQKKILEIIVKIDFCNGDVNDFLEHLARGYIKNNF